MTVTITAHEAHVTVEGTSSDGDHPYVAPVVTVGGDETTLPAHWTGVLSAAGDAARVTVAEADQLVRLSSVEGDDDVVLPSWARVEPGGSVTLDLRDAELST